MKQNKQNNSKLEISRHGCFSAITSVKLKGRKLKNLFFLLFIQLEEFDPVLFLDALILYFVQSACSE